MSGKTVRVLTVSLLLVAGGMHASAQAPSENVTVTATKSREVLGEFTKAFATPTRITGKIARWERRLCPVVMGQNPNFTTFIMQRVKYVALAAGAPVNTEPSCTPNIEIVFTTTPQSLLDNVRKNDPDYLGYATSSAQRDALATVTRPIQAWYTTETVELNRGRSVDSGLPLGEGIKVKNFGHDDMYVPQFGRSNGNHIDDGIHSSFNHILIVIDSTKLRGQKIVPLADYISMLALTQLNALDTCQQLPSIVNILAVRCDHAADGSTQFDLAYLQGLYKMSAGRSHVLQRNEIADAMAETLAKTK
jgi:hypothetical protein